MSLKSDLKQGFRTILNPLTESFNRKKRRRNYRILKKRIFEDYQRDPQRYTEPALAEAVENIRRNGLTVFPYDYVAGYKPENVKVQQDAWSGLKYVVHNGRKLYFKRGDNDAHVAHVYNSLLKEQDSRSPHVYETGSFKMAPGSVLMDVGAAEGIFALDNIEKISHVYLFETEDSWMEPLLKTFEPWKDKVTIINKFASDADGGNTVTIDTFVRQNGITGPVFLKLDVEGAERDVIKGAAGTLSAHPDTQAVICTYHRFDDYEVVSGLMKGLGYNVEKSPGYMLFLYDTEGMIKYPYFRPGVVYCSK